MKKAKTQGPLPDLVVVNDKSQAPEGSKVIFCPEPGPQTEAYLCQASMVLYGGARGGGKTEVSIAKTVAGNPYGDQSQRHNISYIFHPYYRCLVLRQNYKDLLDYKDRAARMYEHFGGVWKESASLFEFPSGAKIILGHLADESAYKVYQGQQYQRIMIEEVTQIESETLFHKVTASCRSTFPELQTQIFLTANPEGPGFGWVKKLFFTHPQTGKSVLPRTPITYTWTDPVTGKVLEFDRIFIPARVWDNKYILENDPVYVAKLAALPENLRRAYLDGDWDALSGTTYFSEFRKNGPLLGEPEWALHCVDESEVWHMPWDRMWCGLDWGFGHYSAIYWFFESSKDKRIYVCEELSTTKIGSYDLGILWARQTLKYINPDRQQITVYMSPDAWHKRDSSPEADEISIVQRFVAGANFVLGKNAVYIPSMEESEEFDTSERLMRSRSAKILVVKAPNHRVSGWQHCRELLSWQPVVSVVDMDPERFLQSILDRPDWQERYLQYIRAKSLSETMHVLPRMRIIKNKCPLLIEGIERAVFAEDQLDVAKQNANSQLGEHGDDEIDAWRYGCAGWTRERQIKLPAEARYLNKVVELQDQYPNAAGSEMAMLRLKVFGEEVERAKKQSKTVYLPRRSSSWSQRRLN